MGFNWLPSQAAEAVKNLDLSLTVRKVPEIDAALSKTVLFRGKKFRPTLCFLVGHLLGLETQRLSPYARAAEFVHAATLSHDDVIDESPVRRNRPTLNARVSNARAVLAGDLLLARVMEELSALGEIHIIHDLSQTVEALVTGEWLQLEARGVVEVNRAHLETVARMKTASLMSWSCLAPARLAQVPESALPLYQKFGDSLGIAFQMIDDIIDYDTHGDKPFAKDLREGLVNFVTLEMLEANPALVSPIRKMLGTEFSSSGLPWKPQELQFACDRVRSRTQAKLEAADQYLAQLVSLQKQVDSESLKALQSILVYLKERVQ